jgi:chemotaxis protein CheC
MLEWSDELIDGLAELMNLGVGRAAASLSEMVGEPINLFVPEVEIVPSSEMEQRLKSLSQDEGVRISQRFRGQFNAHTALFFPESQSLDLVRAVLGEDTPSEIIREVEQESMIEIGNIILNACLGTVVSTLGIKTEASLPSFHKGAASFALEWHGEASEIIGIFAKVGFEMASIGARGHMVIFMDLTSERSFVEVMDAFVNNA